MHLTSTTTASDGTTRRDFVHDGVPGALLTPAGASAGLVLGAHGGGQHIHAPGVIAHAPMHRRRTRRRQARRPGHGERPRTADDVCGVAKASNTVRPSSRATSRSSHRSRNRTGTVIRAAARRSPTAAPMTPKTAA
ncbi:hypothetical protein GCM10011609_29800 [Lentzea pudingi]|uniref:Uncharacterized protein n=1 Tax=Lentzea pudingi TaxID=1789439 RepID=A0ABQ2HUY5_9PSEU|nr:hypothetical protein [Lentzea pudingi]GGM90781.1 hypothetical protein GCM10011609_29800 [Lentzea pudingi]